MQKNCSKCGEMADYDGDLHCRKIFKNKINDLVMLNEVEKAKLLFTSSLFDEEWKKSVLNNLAKENDLGRKFRDLLTDEEQFERIRKEVEEYDIWARKEADLNSNRQSFEEIAGKYKVDIRELVDVFGPTHLGPILLKIDNKKYLEDSEVKWLEYKHFFNLLGIYYYLLYKTELSSETVPPFNFSIFLQPIEKKKGEIWSLAKASKYFRKARNPQKTIEISREFVRSEYEEPSDASTADASAAVFTSRGGAFKDLKNIPEAKKSAFQALQLSPGSPHPYNLLGAIFFLENNLSEGTHYFDEAIRLGSNPRTQELEIGKILKESEQDNRKSIIDYLFGKDPIKYAWVVNFK